MDTNYIINSPKFCRAAREFAGASKYTPVSIIDDDGIGPELIGEPGGSFTLKGDKITHPQAYSKVGWSNMVYLRSTLEVQVPEAWAVEYFSNHYPKVEVAGFSFFVKKKFLRAIEREVSKYERDILKAPKEKYDILINSMMCVLHGLDNSVVFAKSDVEVDLRSYKNLVMKNSLSKLGYTPQKAAERYGSFLTKEDAKGWFSYKTGDLRKDGYGPWNWLQYQVCNKLFDRSLKEHYFPWHSCNDTKVIYWILELERRGKVDLLYKSRKIRGPHQEELTFKFLDRLDEVRACDLENGIYSSVKKTFENAAKRVSEQKIKKLKRHRHRLMPDPIWWPGDCEDWKLLRTGADLIQEGEDLVHCVGSYIPYVKNNKSIIVSINPNGKLIRRSTLEINPETIEINAHLGYDNCEVTWGNKDIVARLIRECKALKFHSEQKVA